MEGRDGRWALTAWAKDSWRCRLHLLTPSAHGLYPDVWAEPRTVGVSAVGEVLGR
ncbi:hypothetical protein ACRAWD_02830 [Caulobacter segnis]